MLKFRYSLLASLSRDRSAKRVDLKLSKIPTEFVSFDSIRALPPRQLAYTAHLAGRLGMDNEQLWIDIRDSFLDSFGRMKPKLFTQTLVALSQRELLLSAKDCERLALHANSSAWEFRLADQVLILQAFANLGKVEGEKLASVASAIIGQESELDEKNLASLFGALGKLRLANTELLDRLVETAMLKAARFNEFEVSAIIRTLGSFAPNNSEKLIENFILNSPAVSRMDMGCVNIVLNAFSKLQQKNIHLPPFVLDAIISKTENLIFGAEIDHLPYLLLSISHLSRSDRHVVVWTRLASTVLRNSHHLKPVSLPVAVEAGRSMRNRNFDNRDVSVIVECMETSFMKKIDEFLVLTSEDMKMHLLKSKQCVYAPWFADMIKASLDRDIVSVGAQSTVSPLSIETALASEDGITVHEFNYLFRSALKAPCARDYVRRLLEKFESKLSEANVKTVCRALQASFRYGLEQHSQTLVAQIVSRFHEVSNEDLLGVLLLLGRAKVDFNGWEVGEFKDSVEARIAVELELVKSFSKRNEIIGAAKRLGLENPEDLIHVWEKTLADDRLVKIVR